MSTTFACLLMVMTSAPGEEPASCEWPPVPDFVHPVDYLEWFIECSRVPADQDAWPLWRHLSEGPDSALSEREYGWLWGCVGKSGWVPGLFTGEKSYAPHDYPWNPKDHWDWEEAYELQQAMGLPEKLRMVSRLGGINWPVTSFVEWHHTPDNGPSSPDRMLSNALFPFLPHRGAAIVLLQNSWRAPRGKINPDEMLEAIETCLYLAEQLKRSTTAWWRVSTIHSLVDDTILAALHHEVFDPEHRIRLKQILGTPSQLPMHQIRDVAEMAVLCELLQFVYAQETDRWTLPPRVNTANLAKVLVYAGMDDLAGDEEALLELASRMDQPDPRESIERLVKLHATTAELSLRGLPPQADANVLEARSAFQNDPANHLLLRKLLFDRPPDLLTRLARAEATRRAVHIMLALHTERDRTGQWPRHLRQIKPAVGPGILEDPFSRKEFVYRIENGQPLLYSVAGNGLDDGGKHDQRWGRSSSIDDETPLSTDYVFWPIQPRADR